MQVNLNTDKTNFGSLKIYKGLRIPSKTYRFNNSVIDISQERLKDLSKDVDIQVRCRNLINKGFDILVSKIYENDFERFFNFLTEDKIKIRANDFLTADNVPDLLLEKITEARDYFLRYKEYLSQ